MNIPNSNKKNGSRQVGRQYVTWFDAWVNQHFADTTGWTEDFSKAKNPYFTGIMCYELRCSYLHSGNNDIKDFGEKEDEENIYSYHFELCINGADTIGTSWHEPETSDEKTKKFKILRIDVAKLCMSLCLSGEEYYHCKGKEAFIKNKIEIVDLYTIYEKLINKSY